MTPKLAPFPDPGAARRPRVLPPALREPIRIVILVGVATMFVGALLPWVRAWKPGTGWFDISGFEQSGDGGIVLELAIVIGVLVWSNRAWRSRMAVVALAPTVLAISCLAVMRVSFDTTEVYLRLLANAGGHGTYQVGFWLTILGAVVTIVGGAAGAWAARGRLNFSASGAARILAGGAGAMAGGIGGFIVGTRLAALLTGGSATGAGAILVALAFTLAFVGAWLGAMLANGAVRAMGR